LRERGHWGDPGVNGGNIKCVFRIWDVEAWTELSWFRMGQVAVNCDCCNESSGSVICGEFLGYLKIG